MTIAIEAERAYRADAIRIRVEAMNPATMPDTAALAEEYLRIAIRAAHAEHDDPAPPLRVCSTCHGLLKCDLDVHRRLR
jgi:hypothetical protein